MGKKKDSAAVMARRKETTDSYDYYPTPYWATRSLFRFSDTFKNMESLGRVWDPACGGLHMSKVLEEYADHPAHVWSSDICDHERKNVYIHDFLKPFDNPHEIPLTPAWIITNPPFTLAQKFAKQALSPCNAHDGVACLLYTSPSPRD